MNGTCDACMRYRRPWWGRTHAEEGGCAPFRSLGPVVKGGVAAPCAEKIFLCGKKPVSPRVAALWSRRGRQGRWRRRRGRA